MFTAAPVRVTYSLLNEDIYLIDNVILVKFHDPLYKMCILFPC